MEGKTALITAIVLLASGCIHNGGEGLSSGGGEGLVTQDFSVQDEEVNPGQETVVELTLKNFNEAGTTLSADNVELFNTGEIEVQSKECTPEELEEAREDFNPEMNCRWRIKAPGEDFVEGFPSRIASVNLVYNYDAVLENQEAFEIGVEENPIETEDIEQSFSNNDLRVSVETTSPVPTEEGRSLRMNIEDIGGGSLESEFGVEYTPETMFSECPDSQEPIQGEANIECPISSSVEGQRQTFFSIPYKYQRIHNAYIEVVNN